MSICTEKKHYLNPAHPIAVHSFVVIYSIIRTELSKILGLATQLTEVIYLLVIYYKLFRISSNSKLTLFSPLFTFT